MRGVIRFLQDLSLLVVRIGFGLLLLAHAWYRWKHVGMAQEVRVLSEAAVPQPRALAWASLGLEAVGIAVNHRGQIEVNESYQTSLPHVYAVGDVVGAPGLASASYDQGRFVGAHIAA